MKKLFLIALIGFVNLAMNAQDDNATTQVNFNFQIPAISILDIQKTGTDDPISFPLEAPTEAGESFIFPDPNTDQWLNYTVMRELTTTKKKITVKLSAAMPPGLRLKIDAIAASSDGIGTTGTVIPGIFVSLVDQVLINDIGTSATGDGVDNGHNIKYTLLPSSDPEAYSMMTADNWGTKTVTYTMSDD